MRQIVKKRRGRIIMNDTPSPIIIHCYDKLLKSNAKANSKSLEQALLAIVDVCHTIVQLSQLTTVPAVCCSYEVTGYALQFINVC